MAPPDDDRDAPADPLDTQIVPVRTQHGVVAKPKPGTREPNLVGEMFGAYLVQARLGGGAMGVVYRASHIDTNRIVALKVLRRSLLDEPKAIDRFVREARLASRLSHPHVGGLYELVTADDRYALALELVEGRPLTSIMKTPVPADRAVLLVAQLLRALEHAHSMGLVHRDLKPDNVLVEHRNNRDHVRIIDFGIAIAREGTAESVERLTGGDQIIGTPEYMAPEQARGDSIDHRADLYALGTIMYEMLAGTLPFAGLRPIEKLAVKVRRPAPTIKVRAPEVTVDALLEQFCMKLIARHPDDRFGGAREALTVLELIASDPAAARIMLGIMDVERAMAVVWLPDPPA
jgi:serine/threonine-protein kinase